MTGLRRRTAQYIRLIMSAMGCLVILNPLQMGAWFDVAAATVIVWTLDVLSKEGDRADET